MSPGAIVLVACAGIFAGAINTIVGSGSLLTFPVLLALGFSPIVANVSNTVGLVFGSVSGVYGYRRELIDQSDRILRLGVTAALGGAIGGILLLRLPGDVFNRIVPALVLLAVVLVILQPWLARRLASDKPSGRHRWTLHILIFATAMYGGYFGAAQGVILVAVLGTFIADSLQRLNGLKNVIAAVVNGVAAVVFLGFAPVAWQPAAVLALSSVIGAQFGASFGRRIPPRVLRGIIVAAGIAVFIKLIA
ncbi:MAG TPA: sulfite exporter TauE/SafE family protein [Candidatus Dormibacteraeota bacterium]